MIANAVASASLKTERAQASSQVTAGVGSYQITLSNPLAFPHSGDSLEIHWIVTLEGKLSIVFVTLSGRQLGRLDPDDRSIGFLMDPLDHLLSSVDDPCIDQGFTS